MDLCGLRKVSFGLLREGPDCSTDNATRSGYLFLNQLNRLHELRELDLSFNRTRSLGRSFSHTRSLKLSPVFALSLDPVKGLPRLRNLSQLEKLVIHGLAHDLGRAEIEWMREHWRRLFSIEVPLIHFWLGEKEAIASCRSLYRGGVPPYQEWFCQLKVVIPAECHRCVWDAYLKNERWVRGFSPRFLWCGCQLMKDGRGNKIAWGGPDARRNEEEYEDRQEWLVHEDALPEAMDQYDGLYMGWHFKRRPRDHTKYARKYR